MQSNVLWKVWITYIYMGGVYLYNDYNDMQYLQTTKIIRTGTSLCVVIPKNILQALKIQRGDQIAFGILDENTIAIRKIFPQEIANFNSKNI